MKILDVPQSGSVAGVTSSRNRYGQYRRTRATPVNPNSIPQVQARAALTTFSQAWRELTGLQKLAWNAYASVTSVVDRLGQTIFLTGMQWFVKVNAVRAKVNDLAGSLILTVLVDPPVGLAPPAGQTITYDISTTTFELEPVPALNEETFAMVEASLPQSAGRFFNGDYRTIGFFPAEADAAVDFQSGYVSRFGALQIGNVVFTRVTLWGVDGTLGYSLTARTEVAA